MTQDPAAAARLTIGSHLAPEDGACLMETVSIAAGLPFSDAPTCTPPLLAHLARLVNDASSTAGRQELSAFIPALATTSGAASAADRLATPDLAAAIRLVRACTEYALEVHPTPLLWHFHALAVRLGRRHQKAGSAGRWGTLIRRASTAAFLRGAAPRGLEASVTACVALQRDQRDPALAGLLRTGITAADGRSTAAASIARRLVAPRPR